MKATIINVGSEILLGNIVDTNSNYLAGKLANMGIDLHQIITVGDNPKRLKETLKMVKGKYDYVFMTGGLGPTEDDITKEMVCKVCNRKLYEDKNSVLILKEYFKDNETAWKNNIKQALFPKDAIIIPNKYGTAPGMLLKDEGTSFILMPGVPREMKYMFENEIVPKLESKDMISSRIAMIGVLGEWDVSRRMDLSGTNPTISPYAKDYGIILRITAKAKNEDELKQLLDTGEKKVRNTFKEYVLDVSDEYDYKTKSDIIIEELKKRGETISFAESMTGGMLASAIIDADHASDVLKESYITYSDEAKNKILNVDVEALKQYSAVSKEVCEKMAYGLKEKTKANIAVSVTGYAHTGEVYIGINYNESIKVHSLQLGGDRNHVRNWAKNRALDYIILELRNKRS